MLTISLITTTAAICITTPFVNLSVTTQIKQIITKQPAREGTSFRNDWGFYVHVAIPNELSQLYTANRELVLDTLSTIVIKDPAENSVSAAAYAIALIRGGMSGTYCVRSFDKDTYDKYDKAWECTPREHWTMKIQDYRKTPK